MSKRKNSIKEEKSLDTASLNWDLCDFSSFLRDGSIEVTGKVVINGLEHELGSNDDGKTEVVIRGVGRGLPRGFSWEHVTELETEPVAVEAGQVTKTHGQIGGEITNDVTRRFAREDVVVVISLPSVVPYQESRKMKKKLTKAGLVEMVRSAVLREVDMRSKDGRELKSLAQKIVDSQNQLEIYTESIKALLDRHKELKAASANAEKALLQKMEALDVKTVEITEVLFTLDEKNKYSRVEPSYKALYEEAISQLQVFSQEQVTLIEAVKDTEIKLKRAETVPVLTRHSKAVNENLSEQVMSKVGAWFRRAWSNLVAKVSRTLQSADDTLTTLNKLV